MSDKRGSNYVHSVRLDVKPLLTVGFSKPTNHPISFVIISEMKARQRVNRLFTLGFAGEVDGQ